MGQRELITEKAGAEEEQPLMLNKARAKSLREEAGEPDDVLLSVSSPCCAVMEPCSLTARLGMEIKVLGLRFHTMRQEMQ